VASTIHDYFPGSVTRLDLKSVVDNLLVPTMAMVETNHHDNCKVPETTRQGHINLSAALALATDTGKQGSTEGAHRRRGLDMVDFLAQHDGTLHMFLLPVNGSSTKTAWY
jgi:hypothetical protein